MQTRVHPLLSPASGTQRQLHSFHYGASAPGLAAGRKAYLQASLHADELPGMLVLHHLRALLERAEQQGDIAGEIILVPVANPIGLNQSLMHHQMGRFELMGMENFNRHYPDFFALIAATVEPQLTLDETANRRIIRAAMHQALQAITPRTELQTLRHTLAGLALDADVVLDLHCDFEAVMHVYVEQACLAQAAPLTRYLGAQTVLWANGSGGNSFDEAMSGVWWRLRDRLGDRFPIPLACLACTVELRGQADIDHATAQADARHLFDFLQHEGLIAGQAPPLPAALCEPHPLAGNASLCALHAGVIVFVRAVGEDVAAGDVVAHIMEPLANTLTDITSPIAGRMYARHNLRWATTGMEIARVSGAEAYRTGPLLSP